MMRETYESDGCGRAAQLVGYLYGEAAAGERTDFERHLHDCAACREEVAAFTRVRGSVAEFRDELIRAAPPVSLAPFAADAGASHDGCAPPVAGPRRSAGAAWAALREFFRLSPAWLRVSTAAASPAVCALALLAVLNAEINIAGERYAIRTGLHPTAAQGADAPPAAQSEELTALQARLKSLAAERDAAVRELEATREELDDSRAANLDAAEFETETLAPRDSPATRDVRRPRRAPSAASKPESTSRGSRRRSGDEDLPRLLDLLGDAN